MRNEQKPDRWENWDQGIYQTGPARPPKSHIGVITLLLVAVILLCSLVTVLSYLNLFHLSQAGGILPLSNHHNSGNPNSIAASTPTLPEETVAVTPSKIKTQSAAFVTVSCREKTAPGVVLTKGGYLLTSSHVLTEDGEISVSFSDGKVKTASVVGQDELTELAVLWVDADRLTPVELGDFEELQAGDLLTLQSEQTTVLEVFQEADCTVLKTTGLAEMGTPLLNSSGQVVGIFLGQTEDGGLCLSANSLADIANALIRQGYVSGRPAFGGLVQTITPFDQLYYHLPSGVYVTQVTSGGSAEKAGIQAGDVILTVEGRRIVTGFGLKRLLYAREPGDSVELLIYRQGRLQAVTVILGDGT